MCCDFTQFDLIDINKTLSVYPSLFSSLSNVHRTRSLINDFTERVLDPGVRSDTTRARSFTANVLSISILFFSHSDTRNVLARLICSSYDIGKLFAMDNQIYWLAMEYRNYVERIARETHSSACTGYVLVQLCI